MITDADIKKMKAVFATKEDLKAMDKRIDSLSNSQRQNTEDLIELITSGFDRTEKAIRMISDHDEIIENHERRLDKIEDKIFA
ncbi:MAG: hypothetical protein AAB788_04155 [Patescibacteria group bacterium]